jgi:hypothetical protein
MNMITSRMESAAAFEYIREMNNYSSLVVVLYVPSPSLKLLAKPRYRKGDIDKLHKLTILPCLFEEMTHGEGRIEIG